MVLTLSIFTIKILKKESSLRYSDFSLNLFSYHSISLLLSKLFATSRIRQPRVLESERIKVGNGKREVCNLGVIKRVERAMCIGGGTWQYGRGARKELVLAIS